MTTCITSRTTPPPRWWMTCWMRSTGRAAIAGWSIPRAATASSWAGPWPACCASGRRSVKTSCWMSCKDKAGKFLSAFFIRELTLHEESMIRRRSPYIKFLWCIMMDVRRLPKILFFCEFG